MMYSQRENILCAVRFERPDHIPMVFHMNAACWHHYPQAAIVELMASHPLLFPGYQPPELPYTPTLEPWQRAGAPYTDPWGCVWETADDGLHGAAVGHPLADWAALDGYTPPDPAVYAGWGTVDWDKAAANLARAKAEGRLASGSLRHGHTFLALTDIRGYQNVIYDMADDEPRLGTLLGMLEEFNAEIVRRYLALGVEWMGYAEDLGMQHGPMLSPAQFRKHIKPVYRRLMAPAQEAGCIIHMHSDGDIRALVDDLVDSGVQVMNLQDLVNGLEWIQATLKGRVCIDLDIDRQQVVRFGAPRQIDALIREEVEMLGSREGGLMMIHGWYPGVPLENVRALMDAMERYAAYYA